MQALLRVYLFDERPESEVPILRQSTDAMEVLEARARNIVAALDAGTNRGLDIDVVDDIAAVGGGSFACEDVDSVAVAVRCPTEKDAVALARRMRNQEPPILTRIKSNEVRLNLRSVLPYEDDDVVTGLNTAFREHKPVG
jgi:L-seryl-tRNA(Ser) seleniumtransferase